MPSNLKMIVVRPSTNRACHVSSSTNSGVSISMSRHFCQTTEPRTPLPLYEQERDWKIKISWNVYPFWPQPTPGANGSVLLVGADLRGRGFRARFVSGAASRRRFAVGATSRCVLEAQLQGVVSSGLRFQARICRRRGFKARTCGGAASRRGFVSGAASGAGFVAGAASRRGLEGAQLQARICRQRSFKAWTCGGRSFKARICRRRGFRTRICRRRGFKARICRRRGFTEMVILHNPSTWIYVESLCNRSQKESLNSSQCSNPSSQPVARSSAAMYGWMAKTWCRSTNVRFCLTDQNSQLKCKRLYDVRDPDRRQEFMTRLHESLVTLACEDDDIARGFCDRYDMWD